MKLIVGLGNPGLEYAMTRHNVGFMVVDHLIINKSLGNEKKDFNGLYIKTKLDGEDVIFLKPQTYMNNSGECVRKIVDYFKIELEDIVVIHDDLDLPVGYVRIREHSHSGGHNGIKSLIEHLGTDNFKRIRIGIGKNPLIPVIDYVLGKFTEEEKVLIKEAIVKSASASLDFITMPFNRVMTKYNKKEKEEPK